jgi:cobalamin-dependent methionine synthase I
MAWLVGTVGAMSHAPVSLDSSSAATISVGIEAAHPAGLRPLLNSAALDRLDVLDLAATADSPVVVSAAGSADLPSTADDRVANAMRMVEAATSRGIPLADLHIDTIVLPVAVSMDGQSAKHFLDAVSRLRSELGPDVHLTGGLSNVSFGMPERRLVNDVFLDLAMQAGADSGIIDRSRTIATRPRSTETVRTSSRPMHSWDLFCMEFLGLPGGRLGTAPAGTWFQPTKKATARRPTTKGTDRWRTSRAHRRIEQATATPLPP